MNCHLMAAAAASALALATAAAAVEATPSASTLRTLGAQVELRIGTAATPLDLSDPTLSQITSDQFSVLTPENEMKWQVVEPQQGTFDWTGADNLVNFAEEHGERVRGHTLVWHNQLPNWLTQGVANGTISDSQLRDLLRRHITTEVSRRDYGQQPDPIVSSTDPTPNHTANPAAADWYTGMLQSCLTVQACISFTVWGFGDAESWVPSTFKGEGDADLYDVNLNPKPQYTALQQTLSLSGGAPHRRGPNDNDHD